MEHTDTGKAALQTCAGGITSGLHVSFLSCFLGVYGSWCLKFARFACVVVPFSWDSLAAAAALLAAAGDARVVSSLLLSSNTIRCALLPQSISKIAYEYACTKPFCACAADRRLHGSACVCPDHHPWRQQERRLQPGKTLWQPGRCVQVSALLQLLCCAVLCCAMPCRTVLHATSCGLFCAQQ